MKKYFSLLALVLLVFAFGFKDGRSLQELLNGNWLVKVNGQEAVTAVISLNNGGGSMTNHDLPPSTESRRLDLEVIEEKDTEIAVNYFAPDTPEGMPNKGVINFIYVDDDHFTFSISQRGEIIGFTYEMSRRK